MIATISGKDKNQAAEDLRRISAAHPEVKAIFPKLGAEADRNTSLSMGLKRARRARWGGWGGVGWGVGGDISSFKYTPHSYQPARLLVIAAPELIKLEQA